MNHCCDPNCETQKWNVNGDIRVGLFAVRDISAGDELTFNYNLECVSNSKDECKCGAGNCSGFIGERPKASQSIANNASSSIEQSNTKKRKLSDLGSFLKPDGDKKQKFSAELSKRAKSLSHGQTS
jgi:hypothetical protein